MAEEETTGAEGEPDAPKEKVSRVKGMTTDEYDGVGIRTLEAWLKYWQNEEKWKADNRDKKTADAEVAKLTKEIEARRADLEEKRQAREAAAAAAPAGDES